MFNTFDVGTCRNKSLLALHRLPNLAAGSFYKLLLGTTESSPTVCLGQRSPCGSLSLALLTFLTPSRLSSYGVRCQSACAVRPVPLLHFTPSGYCPSQQVGHSYLCLPLLPFPAGIAARAAASEVYSLLEVFPILRSRIDPHGCSALQGFHLSRSCFAASSKLPASRFDGSQVLSPRLSWLAMGQSRSAWLAPDVRGSRCRPS